MATVVDYADFNAQEDAETLRKAMKGLGTDEAAITFIFGSRSNKQRQEIKTQFKQMFGKDLVDDLKSELGGHYEDVIVALMKKPDEYDADELHNAISGLGTDERALIEILCSRSNAEINAIKAAYKRLHKADLEEHLQGDTSGSFKRLLTSLVQAARKEDEPVDEVAAVNDARALFEAGEKTWGTDESRFNVVLASRSFPQLEMIFHQYQLVSNKTLEQAIKNEFSGSIEDGLLAIGKCAQSRPAFFAERLYKSMKGLGTDDKTLIRIMVSRCEVDMVQIKQEFERTYGKTLNSFIADDCSGDYKKILLKLCGPE